MKLVAQSADGFEYRLNRDEAACLRLVLQQFPAGPNTPASISHTGDGDQDIERTHLLNQSLAWHRAGLKRKALDFLAADRLKMVGAACHLRLSAEEKEFLLQLLNHVRVGCWRELGEPADLETYAPTGIAKSPDYFSLMELAGFFEYQLLAGESGD